MAEVEEALIDLMLAEAAIVAAVATRIYFAHAPQTPSLPWITMSRVAAERVASLNGPNGLTAAYIQLDAYATSLGGARTLANLCRDTIDGFRGVQSGVNIQGVMHSDETDGYTPEVNIWRVTQQFKVWYLGFD